MNTKQLKVYKSKYFKINKLFLDIVGLWPFSSPMFTLTKQILTIMTLLAATVPNIAGLRTYCGNNKAVCCENISAILFFVALLLKLSVNLLNRKRMIKVYEFVSTNWLSIQDPDEQEINEEFAKQGRAWTVAYSAYLLGGSILCTQVPLIAPILDFIIPLNDSRQKLLTLNAEFGFDPYKYFYELYFGYTIIVYLCAIVLIAFDTTFIVVALQCIGMFHIVGHRVQKATYNTKENESCAIMLSAIKLHNSALQFLKIIESAYNFCLLVLLGLTIAGLAVGFIVIVETIHEPLYASRFIPIAFAIYFHLICITIPGQKVTDVTTDLFRKLYDNEWYNMPKKPKTILKIMMMRCVTPAVLTAGGLYEMNFENIEKVTKTIVSYAMVLLSIT